SKKQVKETSQRNKSKKQVKETSQRNKSKKQVKETSQRNKSKKQVKEKLNIMATIINDRIDVRISREQKELVKYASELRGFKSLSEFVIFCLDYEAKKIIKENSNVLKTLEDRKIFLDAILNPPSPNADLKKARLNYLKFKETNGNKSTK
ncbi:MAG: type II toxin-antitoxin system TacA family antitoxin, partial [Lutibacter sp.]